MKTVLKIGDHVPSSQPILVRFSVWDGGVRIKRFAIVKETEKTIEICEIRREGQHDVVYDTQTRIKSSFVGTPREGTIKGQTVLFLRTDRNPRQILLKVLEAESKRLEKQKEYIDGQLRRLSTVDLSSIVKEGGFTEVVDGGK